MKYLIPLLVAGLFMVSSSKARGLRNNNPGNIRYNPANNWKGQVPNSQRTDNEFAQFTKPEYGLRALYRLLNNYLSQGHDTVEKVIKRYAPKNENDTQAYINFVSSKMGVLPYQTIYPFNLKELMKAIIQMENGSQPFSDEIIEKSFYL